MVQSTRAPPSLLPSVGTFFQLTGFVCDERRQPAVSTGSMPMLNRLLMVGALAAAVALPAVARADDVRHPAEDAGEAAGAAAGAIVGGTIGAAGAIVGGILDP